MPTPPRTLCLGVWPKSNPSNGVRPRGRPASQQHGICRSDLRAPTGKAAAEPGQPRPPPHGRLLATAGECPAGEREMQTLGVPLTPPQDPRLLPTHLPSAWQPPLPGSVTAPPGSRGAGLGRRPLAGCSVIRDPLSLPRHPSPQHVALGPPSHRRLSVPFLLLPARPSSFRPPSITITVDYTPGPRHYVPSRASFSQRPKRDGVHDRGTLGPRKEPTRQYLSHERMMTPDVSELSTAQVRSCSCRV